MRLLVLGGSVFLGRHIVEAALAQGHALTLLNRGRRNPGLFPRAEHLIGDRDADMGALRGRSFDAVIDCSGYTPVQIDRTRDALGAEVAHYLFVSSISVVARFAPGQRFDEGAALAAGDEGYGPLKARAEEAVDAAWPARVAIVRPGLIVGPHDPTGRFTYWPRRVARGGEVLAPGRPDRPVQFIDARDLAAWCLLLAQERTAGVFNAVGPNLTMAGLLDDCRAVADSDAHFTWVGDDALLAEGIAPWTGLPLWLPEQDPDFGGMMLADNRHAVDAGLRCRSVRETIRDTLDWIAASSGDPPASVATISAEDEARCLAAARA